MVAVRTIKLNKHLQQGRHETQRYQRHHHYHHTPQLCLPGLRATSFLTILTLVCLETVLLSTVSNCAKTFYMHWNTTNSIFRIDNTDHIIDVNKGNPAFEFDQVHIICPVYEPGTFENETEKYIIYNVSKVEYETCRITNADPRVIAICDKPQKLMFFTITFRPFTPQPGGLEFLPGNDYYFISTSSKEDLYRRIGGRCSTNNMKVVFKVCCAPDETNRTNNNLAGGSNAGFGKNGNNNGVGSGTNTYNNGNTAIQQQHNNNINNNNAAGSGGSSMNTNIDQFNRIPMQQPNIIGGGGVNGQHPTGIRINNVPSSLNTNSSNVVQNTINWPDSHGEAGNDRGGGNIEGSINLQHNTPPPTIGIHPHFYITSPRPNTNSGVHNTNYSPSLKTTNKATDYDKHPNEVVKNEELTYNSAASSVYPYKMTQRRALKILPLRPRRYKKILNNSIRQKMKSFLQLLRPQYNCHNSINEYNTFTKLIYEIFLAIVTIVILVTISNIFLYKLYLSSLNRRLPLASAVATLPTPVLSLPATILKSPITSKSINSHATEAQLLASANLIKTAMTSLPNKLDISSFVR